MTYTFTRLLTLAEFLNQYQDNPRYELANGELIDMEPTGPHETVSGKLAMQMGESIKSPTFEGLELRLDDILPR